MEREKSAWELTRRYFLFSMSIILSALGIGLSIKGALGVSPISSVPYSLALIIPAISLGTWNALWNFLQIALQPLIRPRDIHWREIFIQCIMTCFFGYFIDLFMELLVDFNPDTYPVRVASLLVGCVAMAVGAYFGVIARVTMLPMDALWQVVADVTGKSYATLRVIGDLSFTIISAVLCMVFLGELIGVREGTLLAALTIGNMIRFMLDKFKPFTYFILPEDVLSDKNTVVMPVREQEEEHFIITLSHEYGSGGRTIARRIAHELGMAYYDSEIIELAAKKGGYSEHFVQENEERIDRTALDKLVDWYGDSYSKYQQEESTQKQLFRVESQVIQDIAAKDSCVIVGRLANYVLRDHGNSLHIFITADDIERVNRVMRKENLSEQEAATKILAFAEERKNHCHDFSELEWGNSLSYDITMKSSRYGVDRTAAILIEMIKQFRNR